MRAWMFSFGDVALAVPANASRSVASIACIAVIDRQRERLDTQVRGELPRILDAAAARVGRRHQDAQHVIRPEGLDGDRGGERRVDAAGKPEHRTLGSRICARSRACRGRAHARSPIRRRSSLERRNGPAVVEIADHDVGVERAAPGDRDRRPR